MGSRPSELVSLFSELEDVPLDAHHALQELYDEDTHPHKVILGAGVYQDDDSKPWVLSAVQKAEAKMAATQDPGRYKYLPIQGYAPFISVAREVIFGSTVAKESRIVTLQTISGTGANFLGARFLSETLKPSAVWLSDPTWSNHNTIWELAGVIVKKYPYWDAKTKGIDFEVLSSSLERQTAPGDVVLLHACAHNPTSVDLTKEQWKKIADICERKRLFPFFDCAYQGFASGDLEEDAWAVRHFLERGTLEIIVAQSFSKNMGLYGERIGALHLVCGTSQAAVGAKGQLYRLQRGQISRPPRTGARLVAAVISDEDMLQHWSRDLKVMSGRIKEMRQALYDELRDLKTPGRWDHIASQIGMYSYTGLTAEQVAIMQTNHHVYVVKSGRISVAGLTTKNVKYVARAIDAAVRTTSG